MPQRRLVQREQAAVQLPAPAVYRRSFPLSAGMTGIDHDRDAAPRSEYLAGRRQCRYGRRCAGDQGLVAARQVAKVEGCGMDFSDDLSGQMFQQRFVPGVNQGDTIAQTGALQQLPGGMNGLGLDVEAVDMRRLSR